MELYFSNISFLYTLKRIHKTKAMTRYSRRLAASLLALCRVLLGCSFIHCCSSYALASRMDLPGRRRWVELLGLALENKFWVVKKYFRIMGRFFWHVEHSRLICGQWGAQSGAGRVMIAIKLIVFYVNLKLFPINIRSITTSLYFQRISILLDKIKCES